MIEKLPYQSLIRSEENSTWRKFNSVARIIDKKIDRGENIAHEIFAVKMILDEQWHKWFVTATNATKTNSAVQVRTHAMLNKIETVFNNTDKSAPFSKRNFWANNTSKLILQVLSIDFFIYGDSLRTNFERYDLFSTILDGFNRNLVLAIFNFGFYYVIPIFLITVHPLFVLLLIFSVLHQSITSYRRTKRFYFLNEIDKQL